MKRLPEMKKNIIKESQLCSAFEFENLGLSLKVNLGTFPLREKEKAKCALLSIKSYHNKSGSCCKTYKSR